MDFKNFLVRPNQMNATSFSRIIKIVQKKEFRNFKKRNSNQSVIMFNTWNVLKRREKNCRIKIKIGYVMIAKKYMTAIKINQPIIKIKIILRKLTIIKKQIKSKKALIHIKSNLKIFKILQILNHAHLIMINSIKQNLRKLKIKYKIKDKNLMISIMKAVTPANNIILNKKICIKINNLHFNKISIKIKAVRIIQMNNHILIHKYNKIKKLKLKYHKEGKY